MSKKITVVIIIIATLHAVLGSQDCEFLLALLRVAVELTFRGLTALTSKLTGSAQIH